MRDTRPSKLRVGRKSFADKLRENAGAHRLWAAGSPKGAAPLFQDTPEKREVRAKREPSTSNGLLEADVLEDSLAALRAHPNVAFAWRLQSGVFKDGERFVRVGFKGMPDIVGMTMKARFFAVEIKREVGGTVTPEQRETLNRIGICGGLAGVAHSAAEAIAIIS